MAFDHDLGANELDELSSEFLERCEHAPARAEMLAHLEALLDDDQRRHSGLRLLQNVARRSEDFAEGSAFRIVRIPLPRFAAAQELKIILVPSIFAPEAWSRTFLEGMLRKPAERYFDRTMVELGTGSGWVSLAMLQCTRLRRVVGLDLNPIAVRVARINAYLNSFDDAGRALYDPERRLLHERVEFRSSDLLESCLQASERFDFIVGCIPQVIAPSPDFDPAQSVQQLDEARLYDLSNYFVLQGLFEDQFGLGLLAKALEQSVYCLHPSGRVILNVAGRPGARVIERMFTRRGFHPRDMWSRRVSQAEDTNISTLAQLEARTRDPFEFYMDRRSREPVAASVALELLRAEQKIWHDLRVIEAGLHHSEDLGPFYESMRQLGYASLLDQLDLSTIDGDQVAFLRRLAQDMCRAKRAPYTDLHGDPELRASVAQYFERYFDLPCATDEIFVGPSRQALMHITLLCTCDPGDKVLLGRSSSYVYTEVCAKAELEYIVGNDDIRELSRLAELLRPRVIIVSLSPEEQRNGAALDQLLASTAARGQRVIVDDSEGFEISSQLRFSPIFEHIARPSSRGQHLVLVGLIHNRVYPSLQPALLLRVDAGLGKALGAAAEATYSRNNTFTERYYAGLFDDVSNFQLPPEHRSTLLGAIEGPLTPVEELAAPLVSQRATRLFELPAYLAADSAATVAEPESPQDCRVPELRVDWGENELELPDRLVQGLLLGHTNIHSEASHQRVAEIVAAMLRVREGVDWQASEVVLGTGVFPLLFDVAAALRQQLGRAPIVALPRGHYGYLVPVFELAGCHTFVAETRADAAYLWTADALAQLPERVDAILLVNPSNPVGVSHSKAQLDDLLGHMAQHRELQLWADEIFAELDLAGADDGSRAPRLIECLSSLDDSQVAARVVRFGGLSKSFAAGGLRVGWVVGRDAALMQSLLALRTAKIDAPALVATEAFLRGFAGNESEQQLADEYLEQCLAATRALLGERRALLCQLFESHGVEVPAGRAGGLFIFPRIESLYGRQLRVQDRVYTLKDELDVCRRLRELFGLRVNPGRWAGAPDHVRICFSLTPERFMQAERRLREFFRALEGESRSSE